jgi:arylsulfatase A-like enzyme
MMGLMQPLTSAVAAGEDNCFQHRVRSLQGLDRLVDTVLQQVEALGLADNTYVVFTGDNGFHLGEHRLAYGKGQPYESDTRVPLLVRGPGVASGAQRLHGTQHVDLVATIAELAGLDAGDTPWPLDGLSIRALWNTSTPDIDDWRQASRRSTGVGVWGERERERERERENRALP